MCARVHERRYPTKSRKDMKAYVREPLAPEAESSNFDKFMGERAKAVEILASHADRLPPSFALMDIKPKQSVSHQANPNEGASLDGVGVGWSTMEAGWWMQWANGAGWSGWGVRRGRLGMQ